MYGRVEIERFFAHGNVRRIVALGLYSPCMCRENADANWMV